MFNKTKDILKYEKGFTKIGRTTSEYTIFMNKKWISKDELYKMFHEYYNQDIDGAYILDAIKEDLETSNKGLIINEVKNNER